MEALPFIREFEAYQKSEKIDPPLTLPMYMKERYRGGGVEASRRAHEFV